MAAESKEGFEEDMPYLNKLKGAVPHITTNIYDHIYFAFIDGRVTVVLPKDIPALSNENKTKVHKGMKEYYARNYLKSHHAGRWLSEKEIDTLFEKPKTNSTNSKQVSRGLGSYGMVISPALPNVIDGTTYSFPHQVTKLMYLKKTRKNTLQIADRIHREVPELYYNIIPYERKVTLSNIKNDYIKNKLKERISKKRGVKLHTITNNTELYPVRMKDMGYSLDAYFQSAYRTPQTNLYKSLLNIPFRTLLGNMSKLADIVDKIYESGYAHLDIRETNIVCNPNSGELHIIDFDFFMKLSDYYTKYTNIFYAHPVEEAIIKQQENREIIEILMLNPIDFKNIPKVLYRQLYKIIEPQCTMLYNIFQPFTGPSLDKFINKILVTEFIPGLEMFKTYIQTEYGNASEHVQSDYIETYITVMYKDFLGTLDSYGLGIALQHLVKVYDYYGYLPNTDAIFKHYPWLSNNVKHLNKFKEVLEKVINHIDSLTTFNISLRIDAYEFKSLIDELIEDYNKFYSTEGLPISRARSTYKLARNMPVSKRMTPIEEGNEIEPDTSSSSSASSAIATSTATATAASPSRSLPLRASTHKKRRFKLKKSYIKSTRRGHK